MGAPSGTIGQLREPAPGGCDIGERVAELAWALARRQKLPAAPLSWEISPRTGGFAPPPSVGRALVSDRACALDANIRCPIGAAESLHRETHGRMIPKQFCSASGSMEICLTPTSVIMSPFADARL